MKKEKKGRIIVLCIGIALVIIVMVDLPEVREEEEERALIYSIFPAGISLCKEPIKIIENWANVQNFKHEPEWKQRETLKELHQLFADISEKSYWVDSQENIHPDFDNKATDVYFIPAIEQVGEDEYMNLYGAILYEKEGFKGKSQAICKYPEHGVFTAEHESVAISKPSSIRPFVLGSFITADKGWKVTLYEKPGLNRGFPAETRKVSYDLPDYFSYKEFNLSWPPQSLDIKGELIAVLMKPDGESEVFFNETDENLFDTEPAATKLIIISGKIIKKIKLADL